MCGIVGIATDRNKNIDEALLKRMCDVIVHRGPDDYGVFVDSMAGIAMRRLSIIDLSTGHQPLFNEDRSIAVVCNGEIYNYLELRETLVKMGHKFRTNSDVEVIVHLYEEFKENCVDKLNGMFAFVIWDMKRKKLLAARDRLGVKPLYYTLQNKRLVVASELKSIVEDKELVLSLNSHAVDLYLQFQYIPGPHTIYKEVKKLLPGHYITYCNGTVEIQKYWDIDFTGRKITDPEEAVYSLKELLEDAVKKRLVSDVPFGAFLSGGIDSSAVVAYMSIMLDHPVKTFSIGFKGDHNDELVHAKKIAKIFGTEHYEYVVSPPDVQNLLPRLVESFDEPFADSSAIPTFLVSEIARKHVKMVLSGDGGDENFAGYDNYKYYSLVHRINALPNWVKELALSVSGRFPDHINEDSLTRKAKRFLAQTALDTPEQWAASRSQYSPLEKENIYSPEFKARLDSEKTDSFMNDYITRSENWNALEKFLYFDLKTYMADGILVKVDRMSMANSLEVRGPLLDYRISEFAASLHPSLKLKGLTTKYVLKKALKDVLPKDILYRKKQGFSVPLDKWFKGELAGYASSLLLDNNSTVQRYFKKGYLENLINEHQAGRDNRHKIWALLNLELWHKQHSHIES